MTPFNFVMTIDENVRILDTLKVGGHACLGRQKLKLSPFISLLRQEQRGCLLANASQKAPPPSEIDQKKKFVEPQQNILTIFGCNMEFKACNYHLLLFKKSSCSTAPALIFCWPFLKSGHTSRNLGKIMEHNIKNEPKKLTMRLKM